MPLPVFGLVLWALLLTGWHLAQGWVPLLDSANLAFHEAGHPVFGLIYAPLAVYGGTLMQLLLPAACVFQLRREGRIYGMSFCVIWFAENLLNIARYMADARAHQLPLVGGLDPEYAHDWTNILRSWGLLQWDTMLADVLRLLALGLMGWALWRAWQQNPGQRGGKR